MDLLQKQAELEAELRGLKEARAEALSRNRMFNSEKIIQLESQLQGLQDAEALTVQRNREKAARDAAKARAEIVQELNEIFPQWQDSLRQAELGAREMVGALIRAGELTDAMRGRLNVLLADRDDKKAVPIGRFDFELRMSGRIAAILSGLAHPGSTYGNITWHATGQFLESDNWLAKENRLLRPHLKEFLKDEPGSEEDSSE